MNEVVDKELWVGHEVVDGAAGFRFLPALVQRTTERFHHPHLPRGRQTGRGPQEDGKLVLTDGLEGRGEPTQARRQTERRVGEGPHQDRKLVLTNELNGGGVG